MLKELLIFHCKYNLKKESILKADAISRSEGRENAGNGRPTPKIVVLMILVAASLRERRILVKASQ
jgi:hypothetical protein